MQTDTIIYIILSLLAALTLALFQYIYKSKLKPQLKYILFTLRAFTWFLVFLLIVNPKFETATYYNEKPVLAIAVDNSESVAHLKQDSTAKAVYNTLINNATLSKRFNIQAYTFGNQIQTLETLSFNEQQSNITKAIRQLEDVNANQNVALIAITDGNQTYGTDYASGIHNYKSSIYPVILGDSTTYTDLSIKQLNVNRYVYLKNKFPVEIIINYQGEESVNTELKIWSGNTVVFRQALQFSTLKTSTVVNAVLNTNSVGIKSYKAEVTPLNNEKNIINNNKRFAVEVIDQKTKIAIVSDMVHPDLGALKKAIETNQQRSVTILKPDAYLKRTEDFQLAILYQPNTNFKAVFETLKQENRNTFTITGISTDYTFLNTVNFYTKHKITNQTEDFQPSYNANFNTFIVDKLNFTDYPPLKSEFGDVAFLVPNDVLLYKTINGITTQASMLSLFETNTTKHGLLNGEGIWRWRAQTYLDTESFNDFDDFIGKMVQYLSSNKKRSRLEVDYKSFYNGNDNIVISAQYFNKNYEVDHNASLLIKLKNKDSNADTEIPLLFNNSNYTVDLSGVEAGEYQFIIQHKSEPVTASGRFTILDFNVEQQFLNADYEKLQLLAQKNNGIAYFKSDINQLIETLTTDKKFPIIQKSTKEIIPLINWIYILGFTVLTLTAEWLIRKYNGLV